MVNIFRLITLWFLVAFAPAHALLPPIENPPVTVWGIRGQPDTGSSKLDVVSKFCARSSAGAPVWSANMHGFMGPGWTCGQWNTREENVIQIQIPPKEPYSCPANSIMIDGMGCHCEAGYEEKDGVCRPSNPCPEGQEEQGGACVPKKCKPDEIRVNGFCVPEPPCPEGETRVNGKCVPAKCPKSGTMSGEYRVSHKLPYSFCESGCVISINTFLEARKDGKVVDLIGIGLHTGSTCSGPDNPPDPDGGGGNGGGPGGGGPGGGGTGGGGTGGGGTGGNGGNGGTGGTGGGSGGGTGGGSGSGGGGGGGNKPSEPDKCADGGCTGNEGKPSEGGVGTNEDGTCPAGTYKSKGKCWPSEPEEKEPDDDGKCQKGYAKVNGTCVPYQPPEDEEEEKPGSFGGTCGSFVCEGDAIQCAIAREQHVRACKLFDDKSPESDLYYAEKGKEGNRTEDLPGNDTVDMSGRIDTSDVFGGGGAGVQDLNLTVAGRSVTLPLSQLNDPLRAFGLLLVAISFLIAVRIIGRG